MTGSDDDFDDFLRRRKPVFRSPDDLFEPPAELDRVVLRQAREAIEPARPVRVFRNPRWATPVALAATLVLGFSVVFYAGLPQKLTPVPEVTVQNIAERVELSEPAAAMKSAAPSVANNQAREDASAGYAASDPVTVDLRAPMSARREEVAAPPPTVSHEESELHATPPPPAAPMVASAAADASAARSMTNTATPSASSAEVPAWRRDAKTWLAEIERLRGAGENARADAEYAEFKRQQRAYAGAPDR